MNYKSIADNFIIYNGHRFIGAESRSYTEKELLNIIAKGNPVNLNDSNKNFYLFYNAKTKIFFTTKTKYHLRKDFNELTWIYIAGPDTPFKLNLVGRLMEKYVKRFARRY